MKRRMIYALIILMVLFLCNCSKKDQYSAVIEKTAVEENLTGIRISPLLINEKNEKVHNIFNFDDYDRFVRVTTICYGPDGKIIDDSDTYNMTLPAKSVSGWNPRCPDKTINYKINIDEMGKE